MRTSLSAVEPIVQKERENEVENRPARRLDVLFLAHEASRTGAPFVLLHLLRWLKSNTALEFAVLLLEGGALENEFTSVAPTYVASEELRGKTLLTQYLDRMPKLRGWLRQARRRRLTRTLKAQTPRLIYVNTIAAARGLDFVGATDAPRAIHFHELESVLRLHAEPARLSSITSAARQFIAASRRVRRFLVDELGLPGDMVEVVHEFIPVNGDIPGSRKGRDVLRSELDLPDDAFVVLGCGTIDRRKGIDLFVQLAQTVLHRKPLAPIHFVWLGGRLDTRLAWEIQRDVQLARLTAKVHLLGERTNPLDYFAAADVFAMVSREDPFPLVVLEAASAATPITCFADAGGASEFVEDDCGFVVAYLDVAAMADAVQQLFESPELRRTMGSKARRKVAERHAVEAAAPKIWNIIERLL